MYCVCNMTGDVCFHRTKEKERVKGSRERRKEGKSENK